MKIEYTLNQNKVVSLPFFLDKSLIFSTSFRQILDTIRRKISFDQLSISTKRYIRPVVLFDQMSYSTKCLSTNCRRPLFAVYFSLVGAMYHFYFAYLGVIYYFLYLSLLRVNAYFDNALLSVNYYFYFALLSATYNFAFLGANNYIYFSLLSLQTCAKLC